MEAAAAGGMAELVTQSEKALVVHSLYARSESAALSALRESGIPVIESLDVAVRCVTALVDRGTWLAESSSPEGVADQQIGAGQRSVESVIPQGKSPGPLPSSIATALTEDRNTLTEPEARELVARFGVPLVEAELCSSEESAVVAVERLRGPAAVKLVATDVAHKTEVGGVALNVMGAEETTRRFGA